MILRCYKCKHAWKDDPVEGQTAFECPKCATLVLVGDFTETTALPRPASPKKVKGPVLPEDQPIAPAARLASGTPIEPAKALPHPSHDETQDFSKLPSDRFADATDTSRFPAIPDPGAFVDKESAAGSVTPPEGVPAPTKQGTKKPPPEPVAKPLAPPSPKAAIPNPLFSDDGPDDLSDMPTSVFRPEQLADPKATVRKGARKSPQPPPPTARREKDRSREPRPEELPPLPTRIFSADAPDAPRPPAPDGAEVRPGSLNDEPTRIFSSSELNAPAPASEDDGGRFGINDEPTRIFSAAELTAMEGQATSVANRPPESLYPSIESQQTRLYSAAELMAMEGQEDPEPTVPSPPAAPAQARKPPEEGLPPIPTQVFSSREWEQLHQPPPAGVPPPSPGSEPPPAAPHRTSPRCSLLEEEIDASASRIPGAGDAISNAETQQEDRTGAFPSMGGAVHRDAVDPAKLATRPITPGSVDILGKSALDTPLEEVLTEGKTPTPKQWAIERAGSKDLVVRPEDNPAFDANQNMTQVSSGPPPGLLAALLETDLPISGQPTPVPRKIRSLIDDELADFT